LENRRFGAMDAATSAKMDEKADVGDFPASIKVPKPTQEMSIDLHNPPRRQRTGTCVLGEMLDERHIE
jgi:hypothetical protein